MKKIGVVAGVVGAGVLAGLGWLFAPAAVVARRIPVTLVWILHVAIRAIKDADKMRRGPTFAKAFPDTWAAIIGIAVR